MFCIISHFIFINFDHFVINSKNQKELNEPNLMKEKFKSIIKNRTSKSNSAFLTTTKIASLI